MQELFVQDHSFRGLERSETRLQSGIRYRQVQGGLRSKVYQVKYFQSDNQFISDHPLWPDDQELVNKIFDKLIALKKKKHLIHNRSVHLNDIRKYYLGEFSNLRACAKQDIPGY